MTERQDMEAVIEAILFVAHDPVSRPKLLEVFTEKEQELAQEALEAVVERYRESPDKGMLIDEVAGGLRLVTRPDLHSYLRRFFEVSSTNKLTMPALETLAIIAYRQPITGPEISELRNVSSTGVLKTLLERRLIRITGRKEVVGKPFLYATTREFLMHFGLKSLKELPPLEQFEELFGDELEVSPIESQEPDVDEEVDREAAELADAEDAAVARQEIEEVEAEREAAEVAEADAETAEEETETPTEAAETPVEEAAEAVAEEEATPGPAADEAPSEDPADELEAVPMEAEG